MPDIMETQAIAQKWERVTPGRTADYENGVRTPRRDWQEATLAATATYREAIIISLNGLYWERGVNAAGTRKWQEKTLAKGPVRWAQGVRLAVQDFARGFDPYRNEIARINLPVRAPRGDPRNLDRVRIIAEALHALKVRIG